MNKKWFSLLIVGLVGGGLYYKHFRASKKPFVREPLKSL